MNAQARAGRSSPGWKRYEDNKSSSFGRAPREIEGRVMRKAAVAKKSDFKVGDRVFHQKFGYGEVMDVSGNKLDVEFEKAGSKKVLEGFVEKA